ncbi:MAG: flagellar hook-associated protein FlgK, partial [Chromatiales bacterium]|nr:flagellar hook-associated protein FlgK [Chromatiales bacterium]
MGMIDTSRSALLVFQRALATTANNIANVNTEGYSRQRVNLNALGSTNPSDSAAPGAGVEIGRIDRAYDQVLTNSVRYDSAAFGRTATFGDLTGEIDRLFASSDSGLSSQIQNYFSATQDVSNDPTSIASRQVLMGEADMLTARFRELNSRLDEISATSNSRLMQVVSEINSFGQQIAGINLKIQDSGDNIPLDLLDARDHLVDQLSERVSVSTIEAQDGTVSVFTGDGQSLVIGAHSETVGVMQDQYQGNGFRVFMGGAKIDVTDAMSGGVIGGILDFQKEIQRPAQNEIGRMAAVLAENFNELHREGYDLNGNTGVDFFNYSGPNVSANTRNTSSGEVTASFVRTVDDAGTLGVPGTMDDVAQLRSKWQASDYELEYDATTTSWSMTRLTDNTTVALTVNNNNPAFPTVTSYTAADGFVVDVSAIDVSGLVAGDKDRFLVRPFQTTAGDLSVGITEPAQFAAANSIDPTYELEYLGVPTANDWKITRLSDGFSATVTNDGLPADNVLTAADSTLSGAGVGLFDEGFEITLPAAPVIGDKYQIHPFNAAASELTTTVQNKAKTIERNVLNTSSWDTYSGGVRVGNNENA